MKKISEAFEKELKGVEAALRRAAVGAKKQAEQQGTPYVVYIDSSTGQFIEKNKTLTQNEK